MLKSPTRQSWLHHQNHHQQQQPEATKSKFVERLLICYPDLPSLCEGKIDETSSLDELTESILYFYNGSDSDVTSSEEAVRFMGLCSALYTFPMTVGDDGEGPPQNVHFGNSTLVFAPLEENKILAFVQVSKGSSALAIRASMQQSHDLFCLLRKGGILPRLSSREHIPKDESDSQQFVFNYSFADNSSVTSGDDDIVMPPDMSNDNLSTDTGSHDNLLCNDDDPDLFADDGCIYPGMKSLYELRKDIRKIQAGMSRITSGLLEVKRRALREDLNEAGSKLFSLLQRLPISSLRIDLKNHYDEYLADPSRSNSCLTETIPRPMMTSNDCSIPRSSAHLSDAIRTLLKHTFYSRNENDPLLVAISSFHKGRLLFTHTLGNENSIIGIDNETSCHIMRYMTHFAHRMQRQPSSRLPSRRSIDRMRLNVKESLQQLGFHKRMTEEGSTKIHQGSFLPPPPLSLLNISDELSEVSTSTLGNVWTPVFYVLVDGQRVPAHVSLFSVQHYSFLLHVDAGALDLSPHDLLMNKVSTSFSDYFCADTFASPMATIQDENDFHEDKNPIVVLLINLSIQLSESVNRAEGSSRVEVDNDDDNGDDNYSMMVTGTALYEPEAGVDIIYVDREHQHVVVQLSERVKRNLTGGSSNGIRVDHDHDVRHVLQSRLPLEGLRALDNMMGVIQEHNSMDDSVTSELCTYLQPSGWIWAGSARDGTRRYTKELYLLFDANVHGTIGAVEAIARRLRRKYLNEKDENRSKTVVLSSTSL